MFYEKSPLSEVWFVVIANVSPVDIFTGCFQHHTGNISTA